MASEPEDLDEIRVLGRRGGRLRNGGRGPDEPFGELDLALQIVEVLAVGELPAAGRLLDQVRIDANDGEGRAQIVEDLGVGVPVGKDGGRARGRSGLLGLPGQRTPLRRRSGGRRRNLQRHEEGGRRERDAGEREEGRRGVRRDAGQGGQRGHAHDRRHGEEARRRLSLAVPRQRHSGRKQQRVGRKRAARERHRAKEKDEVGHHRQRRREVAERIPNALAREDEERAERAPERKGQGPRVAEAENDGDQGEEGEETGRGGAVGGERPAPIRHRRSPPGRRRRASAPSSGP